MFFITNHLITREGGFNCELKSEGEDAESEEAEEGAGDQDVDAHVGHEQQVGEDEHANNSSQTAQLGDLHNFASLLKVKKQAQKLVQVDALEIMTFLAFPQISCKTTNNPSLEILCNTL